MFPPEVALPLGGPGARKVILIEMHYDNPTLQAGTYTVVSSCPIDDLELYFFARCH